MTSELPSRKMGFEGDNLRLILDSMSKLYAVPEIAAVREYLSNAYDSHAKARQVTPVELTLTRKKKKHMFGAQYQSNSTTFFYDITVEDHGEGMTMDEMVDILSNYGATLKKDNKGKQHGKFGYGTKSGLALTNCVTFHAVKDGWRTTAEYSANDDTIDFNVLFHEETTDGNGFTVILENIALEEEHVQELEGKNGSFFYAGWDEGTILVNGQEPYLLASHPDKYIPLKSVQEKPVGYVPCQTFVDRKPLPVEDIFFYCGVVKYSYSFTKLGKKLPAVRDALTSLRGHFIAVPMNAVDFVPARDGFSWTEKTVSNLEQIIENFIAEYRNLIHNTISGQTGRKRIEIILLYSWLVDEKTTPRYLGGVFYGGVNYDPRGKVAIVQKGNRIPQHDSSLSQLLERESRQKVVLLPDAFGEKEEKWVSNNLSDFAGSLEQNPQTLTVLLVEPNHYLLKDEVFKDVFVSFTKKEIQDRCREFRKKKTVLVEKKLIPVFIYDEAASNFRVENFDAADIDVDKTVFILDDDKIVPPREQKQISSNQSSPFGPGLRRTVQAVKLLDANINQYVFWGKKLPSTLLKAVPGMRSINEVFENYYNSLNIHEQKSILYGAYLVHANRYDEFRYVASVANLWLQKEHSTGNEAFETVMRMWGKTLETDEFILNFFTAVLSKNFIAGSKEVFDDPVNHLPSILPLFFSKYANFMQLETYVKAVGFPTVPVDGETFAGFRVSSLPENIKARISLQRLNFFMEQFHYTHAQRFYFFPENYNMK